MSTVQAINRRALLGAAGWLAATGVALAARYPTPSVSQRLKLFNAHTGETFDGPYRGTDGIIPSAAAELSQFLRDFHSGVTVAMDMRVIDFLWDVLSAVGAESATILSAYRTPETNAMLSRTTFGVAEHSQHIYACAIDFTIGSALADAMIAARAMRRGGVGWYPQSHFIHVDTGPVRNWDLGDRNLQELLIEPSGGGAGRMRDASRSRPGPPQPLDASSEKTSQYDSAKGIRDQLVRPSQYNSTSYGVADGIARPSQYGRGF
jgi:uncharacterized protein YcbK (DUF882 family)